MVVQASDSTGNSFIQRYVLSVAPFGTPVPSMTLAPSSLSLSYTLGNPLPAPVPVSIGSTASGYAYTASASTSNGGPWLSVSPASGSAPATANVTLNPTGLPAGSKTGAVRLNDEGDIGVAGG